jgi:hypothetical protein
VKLMSFGEVILLSFFIFLIVSALGFVHMTPSH